MTAYKTILVHLTDDKKAPDLLALALDFARTFDAHLIGLYVFPASRITPPLPLPFGSDVAGRIRKVVEGDVARMQAAFTTATANQPMVCEWRCVIAKNRDACDVVLEHSRAADLIIASQADPDWEMSPVFDFPERLALGAGRPVIVLPNAGRFRFPERITVGWNNRREAARALADAMPLLMRAKDVGIVTVDEDEDREAQLPDTEIGAAVARHGVKARIASIPRGPLTVGEAIRDFATNEGADLLVMGAYGQSRLREMAFGGVTRHMLRETTLPVLFSH